MKELKELTNDMSYEEAYTALKETVAILEDPKTMIDDSLKLYERACKLVIYCQRKLGEAKMEITDINARISEIKKSGDPIF